MAAPGVFGPVKPLTVDPAKTRLLREYRHTAPLVGCRFDPTGAYVLAGSQDNSVVRFHLDTGAKVVLAGHRSWVRPLAFAPAHGLLYSGDWAGKVLAWPVGEASPAPRPPLDAHRGWVRALAVSPDGKTLASCGNDLLVKLWSVPDGKFLRQFAGHENHVYNLAFHPDGKSLVSGDLKGVLKVWDLAKGEASRTLDAAVLYKYDAGFGADIGGVRAMAFSPDGAQLACAGITEVSNAFAGVGKPLIAVFDWATGKAKAQLRTKAAFQGTAWGVVVHPAGFVLGVGGGNGGALWSWKGGEKGYEATATTTLALPNNARDLDLHPDGRRLAIPFFDGAVRVYDLGAK